MKKCLWLLLCLFLVGCKDKKDEKEDTSTEATYHLTTGNYIVLLQYQDYSTGINPTLALSYN
ncbi:Tfp pilus assembly protein PilP [Acholeplasma morum]|uniref:hypothetical protein n=1 Tax=Paracholeplasma morum TaxID=264637 RepID=UPI00195BC4E9|nr:hypothetical protein [Paracholeplasma morum]MBM7453962.1 Tfp pilus assembly protein PilP [Paracholeplasma morum]